MRPLFAAWRRSAHVESDTVMHRWATVMSADSAIDGAGSSPTVCNATRRLNTVQR